MNFYLKNIRALSQRFNSTVINLENLSSEVDCFSVVNAKKNGKTVVLHTQKDKTTYLHSAYDSIKEGIKIADSIFADDVNVFFVIGFGLGYPIKALFERIREHQRIIIVEPNLSLFKEALTHIDYNQLFLDSRIFLITGNTSLIVNEKIRSALFEIVPYDLEKLKFQYLDFYKRWDIYYSFVDRMKNEISDILIDIEKSHSTVYEYINKLRLNGIGKTFLGEYSKCLEFMKTLIVDKEELSYDEVGMLATYFLFSYFSYAENFIKGGAK